jgi:hypothetical protein
MTPRIVFLAVALSVLLPLSNKAIAQECTVSSNEMIGLVDAKGVCHGYKKEFAQKYLHVETSQCVPSPKTGHLVLGNCLAEPPKLAAQDDDSDKRLLPVVEQMQGEIDRLRDEMAAQYHELMSEIENLKIIFNSSRR